MYPYAVRFRAAAKRGAFAQWACCFFLAAGAGAEVAPAAGRPSRGLTPLGGGDNLRSALKARRSMIAGEAATPSPGGGDEAPASDKRSEKKSEKKRRKSSLGVAAAALTSPLVAAPVSGPPPAAGGDEAAARPKLHPAIMAAISARAQTALPREVEGAAVGVRAIHEPSTAGLPPRRPRGCPGHVAGDRRRAATALKKRRASRPQRP